jgi:hypothetical protein
MIQRFGALGAMNPRTFDTYDRIDDMTYMAVHDVLKFYLHGYSRVTDNLCREIRFGRISREDALMVEKYYQAEYPNEEIKVFLDWLGMESTAFEWYAERMPFYGKQPNKSPLNQKQKEFVCSFVANGTAVMNQVNFIVYGKGLDC